MDRFLLRLLWHFVLSALIVAPISFGVACVSFLARNVEIRRISSADGGCSCDVFEGTVRGALTSVLVCAGCDDRECNACFERLR